jgi:glycosyltransferase involved in cell wall biosynthesis
MRSSHFLILPTTASEGFPKVVAEAWSVCCIPISSDISSIGQYVRNHENGFIWEFRKNLDFAEVLNDALNFNSQNLKVLVQNGFAESQKFTYLNYENRLKSILNID